MTLAELRAELQHVETQIGLAELRQLTAPRYVPWLLTATHRTRGRLEARARKLRYQIRKLEGDAQHAALVAAEGEERT